jgi:hypothetical protein
MQATEDERPSAGVTLAEATGDVEHEWFAKDTEDWCTYGRPRGVVTPIINAALGPENAANNVMQIEFRALIAIRTWNGKPSIPPRGSAAFEAIVKRFGEDADADARYQDYIVTAIATLWPTNAGGEVEVAKK